MTRADDPKRQSGLHVEIHFVGIASCARSFHHVGVMLADFFRAKQSKLRIHLPQIKRMIEIGIETRVFEFSTGLCAQSVLRIIRPRSGPVETLAEGSAIE